VSRPLSEDDGWSGGARELLHAYRSDHDPSAFERARLQRALAERPVRPGGPAVSQPQTRGRSLRVALSASANRWFVGACLAAAAVGGFRTIDQTGGAPKPAPLTAAYTERSQAPQSRFPAATPATQAQPAKAATVQVRTAARVHATVAAPTMSPPRRLRAARSMRAVVTPPRAAASGAADGSAARGVNVVPNALPPSAAPDHPDQAKLTARPSDSEIAPPKDTAEAQLERAFMARIQAAVRGAKLRQALALCAEHERRWPHGTFQQEREGVRALAACKLQLADAESRAHGYLADYPHGALAPSVRAACDGAAAAPLHLAHGP
jgi:hypothetical protein